MDLAEDFSSQERETNIGRLGRLNAAETQRADILEALSEVELARAQLDEYEIGEAAKGRVYTSS